MPDNKEQPITVTFPSGKTMSKVVDLLVRKRPIGWSRRSYATYYNDLYGQWIKKDVDAMIKDGQPRVYRYDKFPKTKAVSLYLRVNQSIRYLLEELDPDGIYKKWRSECDIHRIPRVGISICYKIMLDGNVPAEVFRGDEDSPYWMKKIDNYLEAETVKGPLVIPNLLLTPEQVAQIELELSGLTNIIYSVSSREIKIIRNDA